MIGIGEARGALLHVAEGGGLRHQAADGWIEKGFRLVELDAARRQHAAENFRQFVALRQWPGPGAASCSREIQRRPVAERSTSRKRSRLRHSRSMRERPAAGLRGEGTISRCGSSSAVATWPSFRSRQRGAHGGFERVVGDEDEGGGGARACPCPAAALHDAFDRDLLIGQDARDGSDRTRPVDTVRAPRR